MNRTFDFLIVGQGLAGSILHWFLSKENKSVLVIDRFNPSSSSNVAAGIIHPITGRRIVKTWMAETLIPFAEETYREIENAFQEPLFTKINILELIASAKEQNDWSLKSSSEEMKKYFSDEKTETLYNNVLKGDPKKISITQSGWLNLPRMIALSREQMIRTGSLLDEEFDHAALSVSANAVSYRNFTAEKIIFCEGYKAVHNPYWKHLPFLPAKGEILTIRSEQLNIDHIITRKIFILPTGNHLFKVGATHTWDELNETPTAKAKEELLEQLDQIIDVPYKVVDHRAAVRPTVKDRRPFIGLHSSYPNVGIFNGLGTKGVLLAPFFAKQFSDFLNGKGLLMDEVNVNRFN